MTLRKRILAPLIAAALTPQFAVTAHAQAPGYAPAPMQAPARAYTQAELDQMLAPIALYPDGLLSQVLMASTYPIEVVEAARWTRANPGLHGDAAVRAVQNQDWDPSVQSLVAFPQVLQRMDEHLQWTENLGDAFLAQEAEVMDSVQQLRQRAYASGHLRSTPQIRVVQEGPLYYLQPVRPELVYVPYYDPQVVYGSWRWPAYRPVVWAPWPGYARPAPGVSVGFWFGSGISLSANFFFGDFDWGRHSVRVVRPTAYYYRPPRVIVNNTFVSRGVVADRSTWQHDPHHRRSASYLQPEVRQRFASAQVERRDEQRATLREERPAGRREERGLERRPERREAQAPALRQAQPAQPQPQLRAQEHQEQVRPERREAREAQQRSEAERTQRAQLQQREQAQSAERTQRRQQAEQARAQQQAQHQQADSARAQQRQQAEQARSQQQAQRQQAREERKGQREERREQHAGNKGD